MKPKGGKITDLFLSGAPPTPEEVRRSVVSEPPERASDEVIGLIEKNLLLQHHFGLFLEVAKLLNLSTRRKDAMLKFAKDKRRHSLSRQFALLGLTSCQSQEEMMEVFQQVDSDLIAAVSDMPFVDILSAIQLEPSLSCDLTGVLLGASEEEQEFILLHHIGRIRREVGTPASLAYSHALFEKSLSHLHHHMIESLIQERDSRGLALLKELRDSATDEESRRRFHAAMLRVGTLQIEDAPGRNAPQAVTYVSICDGQGAYFLFCRYNMFGGRQATASCCIRAAADIRDAFVLPQQPDDDFEDMLRRLTDQRLYYTEVPAAEASKLFFDALERTYSLNKKLPDSAIPVISLFERIVPIDPEETALEQTAEDRTAEERGVSIPDLHELMDIPHYDSWFFDEGDLAGHGIKLPKAVPTANWFRTAASKLDKTPLKTRLFAMLKHMVRWHRWAGEPHASSLLSAALSEAERDFKKSAIVRAILERSVFFTDDPASFDASVPDMDQEDDPFGSEQLRGTLRRRFFNDLKRPSGLHMAELDFTEIAYHQLHAAFIGYPGEKRPREDDVLDLAYETASEFTRSLFHGKDATSMVERLDKSVSSHTDLSAKERTELIQILTDGMFGFIESVCKGCGVQCLDAPRRGMADEFFSSVHPSSVRPLDLPKKPPPVVE
jgi:hypothetical protein